MKQFICMFIVVFLMSSCATTQNSFDGISLDEAIAQAAMETSGTLSKEARIAIVGFESESSALSEYIMEELIAELYDNGVVDIADRRNLDYIRKELDLQYSGEVDDKSAVSLGKFIGAQKIFVGELLDMGNTYRFRITIVDVESSARSGGVRLNVRSDKNLKRLIASLSNGKKTATSVFKKPEDSIPETAGAYLDRGILFAVRGDFNIAVGDFSEALKMDRDYAAAYLQRGKALLASISEVVFVSEGFDDFDLYIGAFKPEYMGIANAAIKDLRKSVELFPAANAYKYMGICYIGLANYDEAIACFNQAIRLAPNNVSIYNYRSIAYRNKGDYYNAISDCNKAISIDPNYFLGYANRGAYYRLIGEYDKAIADCNHAIKLDPNNGFIPTVKWILEQSKQARGR